MTDSAPERRPVSRRARRELGGVPEPSALATPHRVPDPSADAFVGPDDQPTVVGTPDYSWTPDAVFGTAGPHPVEPPAALAPMAQPPATLGAPTRTSARGIITSPPSTPPPAKTPPAAVPERPVTGFVSSTDSILSAGATALVPPEMPPHAPAASVTPTLFPPVAAELGGSDPASAVLDVGPEASTEFDANSGLIDQEGEPVRHRASYTWLHYLVLVAVAFVLGLLLWQLIAQDRPTQTSGISSTWLSERASGVAGVLGVAW